MPAAVPFIPVIAAGVTAGAAVYGAVEAREQAKEQEKAQRQQAELQRRIETARTKRLQRIRQAQLIATTGAAGITGAVVTAPIIAGQIQEQTQAELIREQTELQKRQYGIQAAQTAAQATATISGAIGAFAAEAGPIIGRELFGGKAEPLVPIGPEGPVRS